MFLILAGEHRLTLRWGVEGVKIVRERLYELECELAYLEVSAGRADLARSRLAKILRQYPMRGEVYVRLMKACVPRELLRSFGR